MAGEEIYCSKKRIRDLDVFVASSEDGLLKIGIAWAKENIDPVMYFKKIFPEKRVIEEISLSSVLEIIEELLRENRYYKIPIAVRFTPFQLLVLYSIRKIRPGNIMTYKQVSEMIGRPLSYRAVGQVLKKNPLPLLFP